MAGREEDPDEILRRKFRAMCRFRMMGRLVVLNLSWMKESYWATERSPRHTLLVEKQLLTLQDKYLLSKDKSWRNHEEQSHLQKILVLIKLFRRYPPNIRRKLCVVTYFKYFGPDRVLVRCNQKSEAMYYIVTGSVWIVKKMYDPVKKAWSDGFAGILGPGEEFGQEQLLHNEPRPFTLISKTGVELLYVLKEDYDLVIKENIQEHWDQIRRYMMQFTYFSPLNKKKLLDGCMLGKLKSFKPKETILGDGKGLLDYIYFILTGSCQIIECLPVRETLNKKKLSFSLYTIEDSDIKKPPKMSDKESVSAEFDHRTGKRSVLLNDLKFNEDDNNLLSSSVSKTSSKKYSDEDDSFYSFTMHHICDLPKDVKVHFMQSCLMLEGGCFGWEDHMLLRRIVAYDETSCLLLPKYWLWANNPFNIWHMLKNYYDRKIPSQEKLFEIFLLDKNWDEYKMKVIYEITKDKKAVNTTKTADVPYTMRIHGTIDYSKKL